MNVDIKELRHPFVGDSLVKGILGWKSSDGKVAGNHFSVSTTEDARTFIKRILKHATNRVIIHVGTNDLRSIQDTETIVKDILYIVKYRKNDKNDILLSIIVPRGDNLNGRCHQVNKFLDKLSVKNIYLKKIVWIFIKKVLCMWTLRILNLGNSAAMVV